jgi:glutaminase
MAVMASCGMYDYAGEWLLRVGLPAKSGVSGGLVAVSPAQFGVGLFSPPLDERGNSVRAVEASRLLSERFSLHLLHRAPPGLPALLHDVTPTEGGRDDQEVATIEIVGLQGNIEFSGVETIVRMLDPLHLAERPSIPTTLIIDLSRVSSIQPIAQLLLQLAAAEIRSLGVEVIAIDPDGRGLLGDGVEERASPF